MRMILYHFIKKSIQKQELLEIFWQNITLDKLKQLPFLTKDELRKYGKTTLLSTKKGKGIF